MHHSIIAQVLFEMGVSLPQSKFVLQLFATWLSVHGRFNFVNLGRYGSCHERTLRRGFMRDFSWPEFNSRLLAKMIPAHHELIAALDASFVPKSGKRTFGLGRFYNGCAGRAEKGLELSVVSLVDVARNTAYELSARQTPPGPGRVNDRREARGPQTKKQKAGQKQKADQKQKETETRVDDYLKHFTSVRSWLPARVRYLAVDGYFTNFKFVHGVCALMIDVVGKLRRDANMRYLYDGPQKQRGRPRLYGDKVQWAQPDLRYWKSEGEIEAGVRLYSAALYHVSLKRVIRVAMLRESQNGKMHYQLFFSTDLQLSARKILRYYRLRYQIEFLFRDGKQNTGINHCQARNEKALHFHWNTALTALNLAKWEEDQRHHERRFSVASCMLRHSNERLLELFSHGLGLDWNEIKSHPAYPTLCSYGVINP